MPRADGAGASPAMSRREALRSAALCAAGLALGRASAAGPWSAVSAGAGANGAGPLPCSVSIPGDRSHAPFRTSWNGCWTGDPRMVAHVRDAGDVSAALRFARREGFPVVVRSGGHSFAGASVGDGLVIDVSPMRAIATGSKTGIVDAGGGVRVGELEYGLFRRLGGRTVTLGSCASVGVSGLLLGGGFSAMSRVHGLTIDALDEVEAVLADGTVVVANERTNADLFWALRGGGAGFAVVTRMSFRTRAWSQAHAVTQHWRWDDGARVLERWSRWIESLPAGASSSLIWMTSGAAANSDVRTIVRSERGEVAAGRIADALSDAVGRKPKRSKQWCTDAPSARGEAPTSGPRTANGSMFGESSVSGTTAELIAERFRSRVESRGAGVEGTVMLLCNAFGGAVARIEPGATAFPHRRARFLAEVAAEWPAGRTDLDDSNRAWVRATVDGARAGFGGGSYVNYADPGMQGWREAYWGANLARLQAIRRAIDPTGVLAGKLSA